MSEETIPYYGSKRSWRDGRQIENDVEADRLVRRVKAIKQEEARLLAIVDARLAALQRKRDRIQAKAQKRAGFWLTLLANYMERAPVRKLKTAWKYPLLSGELVKKFVAPGIEHNDEVLLSWAQEHAPTCTATITTVKVLWGELKKTLQMNAATGAVLDAAGNPVPGVTIVPKPATFEIVFPGK